MNHIQIESREGVLIIAARVLALSGIKTRFRP